MSRIRIFNEAQPESPLFESSEHAAIAEQLRAIGVRFERWEAAAPVKPGASQDEVINADRADIDRLMAEGGYQTVDVVSLNPDHPDRAALRQKFLNEHTHSEDEVRFFVEGRGLFCLHIGEEVLQMLCEQDDWISVPAGTKHWFDMGSAPQFCAIRFFDNPQGWVAAFTGDPIASRFPLLD